MKQLLFTLLFVTVTAFPAQAGDSFPEARKLVNSQGCKACHQLDNEGGNYAQSLEKIGRHRSREQMRKLLVNGTGTDGDRYMPSYSHLREAEIEALIKYLESYK